MEPESQDEGFRKPSFRRVNRTAGQDNVRRENRVIKNNAHPRSTDANLVDGATIRLSEPSQSKCGTDSNRDVVCQVDPALKESILEKVDETGSRSGNACVDVRQPVHIDEGMLPSLSFTHGGVFAIAETSYSTEWSLDTELVRVDEPLAQSHLEIGTGGDRQHCAGADSVLDVQDQVFVRPADVETPSVAVPPQVLPEKGCATPAQALSLGKDNCELSAPVLSVAKKALDASAPDLLHGEPECQTSRLVLSSGEHECDGGGQALPDAKDACELSVRVLAVAENESDLVAPVLPEWKHEGDTSLIDLAQKELVTQVFPAGDNQADVLPLMPPHEFHGPTGDVERSSAVDSLPKDENPCGAADLVHRDAESQCCVAEVVLPDAKVQCHIADVVHPGAEIQCDAKDMIVHQESASQCGAADLVHAEASQCGAADLVHPESESQCGAADLVHPRTESQCDAADLVHQEAENQCGAADLMHPEVESQCDTADVARPDAEDRSRVVDVVHLDAENQIGSANLVHPDAEDRCGDADVVHPDQESECKSESWQLPDDYVQTESNWLLPEPTVSTKSNHVVLGQTIHVLFRNETSALGDSFNGTRGIGAPCNVTIAIAQVPLPHLTQRASVRSSAPQASISAPQASMIAPAEQAAVPESNAVAEADTVSVQSSAPPESTSVPYERRELETGHFDSEQSYPISPVTESAEQIVISATSSTVLPSTSSSALTPDPTGGAAKNSSAWLARKNATQREERSTHMRQSRSGDFSNLDRSASGGSGKRSAVIRAEGGSDSFGNEVEVSVSETKDGGSPETGTPMSRDLAIYAAETLLSSSALSFLDREHLRAALRPAVQSFRTREARRIAASIIKSDSKANERIARAYKRLDILSSDTDLPFWLEFTVELLNEIGRSRKFTSASLVLYRDNNSGDYDLIVTRQDGSNLITSSKEPGQDQMMLAALQVIVDGNGNLTGGGQYRTFSDSFARMKQWKIS